MNILVSACLLGLDCRYCDAGLFMTGLPFTMFPTLLPEGDFRTAS